MLFHMKLCYYEITLYITGEYKIIARARWTFDIFHRFMKKIEPVLPNNFQNGSISIREAALRSIRKATTRVILAIARGLEPCLSIPKSIAYGTKQMIQTNVVTDPLRLEKQKP